MLPNFSLVIILLYLSYLCFFFLGWFCPFYLCGWKRIVTFCGNFVGQACFKSEKVITLIFKKKTNIWFLGKWVLCAIAKVAIFMSGQGHWLSKLSSLLNQLQNPSSSLMGGWTSWKELMRSWRREMKGEHYLLSRNYRGSQLGRSVPMVFCCLNWSLFYEIVCVDLGVTCTSTHGSSTCFLVLYWLVLWLLFIFQGACSIYHQIKNWPCWSITSLFLLSHGVGLHQIQILVLWL